MEDKIDNFFKNEIKNSILLQNPKNVQKLENCKKAKKSHNHKDNKCAGIYGFEKMSEKEKNNFYTKLIDSTKNLLSELDLKKRENLIMKNFINFQNKEKSEKFEKEENIEIEISRFHIRKSQILQKIEKLKKILKYKKLKKKNQNRLKKNKEREKKNLVKIKKKKKGKKKIF